MESQTQPPPPSEAPPDDIVAMHTAAAPSSTEQAKQEKKVSRERLIMIISIIIGIYFFSGSIIAIYSSSVSYIFWNDSTLTTEYLNEICNDHGDVFWRESCDEYGDCKIITPKRRSTIMLIVNSIYVFLFIVTAILCGVVMRKDKYLDNEWIGCCFGFYGCIIGLAYVTAVTFIVIYGHQLVKDSLLAKSYCDSDSNLYQTLVPKFGFLLYALVAGYFQVLFIIGQLIAMWIKERDNPSTDGMI